ncbi:MAG: hypothetical protein JXA44_00320 [Methanospirillaceae archaeon]|nr:hypothetical protein [Methanospirillaceae archaeon]
MSVFLSPDPFDPIQIRAWEPENRFIFSAAASGTATDRSGVSTGEERTWLCKYAGNDIGLVITGAIKKLIPESHMHHPDGLPGTNQ